MKILISDKLSKEAVDILSSTPSLEVEVKTDLKPDELKNIIGGYDALVVRSSTKVTKEIIQAGKNLKIIGRAGIGVDNVDVGAASLQGIIVMNTPGGNAVTTAEHTISMMMSLARKIPAACRTMKEGKWEKSKFVGNELYNKTLGIIGMGRIGSLVAQRAKGLEMKVIAYDPFLSKESAQKLNVPLVTLEELFKDSDFITIHAIQTEQTRHLLNDKAFSQMKKGIKIINCSRGGIIDEEALYRALEEGKVSGAALDVFEEEPTKNLKLVNHENLICTPHLGASTVEAQVNVAIDIAEQLKDYFLNGVIKNAVNIPSVDQTVLAETKKYMDLGEKIGSFITQISEGSLEELSIEYRGEIADLGTKPLTVSIIRGLLTPIMKDVNLVNAPILARERGIKVSETTSRDLQNFANLIQVRLKTDKKSYLVAGTLFDKKSPRIVHIDEYDLEAPPSKFMLVFTNQDTPGVIGRIGTLLGENNINIAGMILGRAAPQGMAISIVNVDDEIPKNVLDQIGKLPNIITAKLVRL